MNEDSQKHLPHFIRDRKPEKKESLDQLSPERLDLADGHQDPAHLILGN